MDYPDDFAVPTDLQLFVLTSIGPALHTLELGAWFPAAAGLDFPVLERLEYCYEQNGGPLPPLPPLKHLRVHSAKGLHDLIPSIGHLHVLDGNIEIDSLYPNPEAEVEDFFAALSLLRSPDILNVKVASSEHMVTNSPAIYEYLCGKGSLLKGLRLDGDVVSASIFAAASLRCRHLTHLVVNVGVAPTVQQLESLGIALFGLRCRNLRKIGFAGCWNRADEDVGEWIRRLKDDLSGLGSIDVELFSHSSFDHVCKEIEDGYSAWWDS
ncbi:hypothetical protein HK097_005973 [Rhizophlyctis rosea]|uniref:Uncharacterized protein n=1 Tax=Rhizophlyctis rosea TaxID=64517 RepID=A0AAD5SJV8_9FUNG|nr:hypothetical protein HK097_005973 [Rhizophlyctis rosea]